METHQLCLVIGSSATLITTGLGFMLSMIKSNERHIRDLEIEVAVMKAVLEERK